MCIIMIRIVEADLLGQRCEREPLPAGRLAMGGTTCLKATCLKRPHLFVCVLCHCVYPFRERLRPHVLVFVFYVIVFIRFASAFS